MKKIITLSFATIVALILFTTSCKKIGYSDIGESISLEKNLIGSWKLDSIIQVDQLAADKGFPAFVQRQNITALFPFSTVRASFVDGGTGKAGTYSFTNPGNAPLFFAPTGNWSYFDNGGPIRIKLAGTGRTDSMDFAKAYRVTDNKLSVRINRRFYSNNKVFVYYDFNFSRN
jgi:Domain of unknown function (DUF5004)